MSFRSGMSKRFNIFHNPALEASRSQPDSSERKGARRGRSVLKLTASWRTQIEQLMTRLYLLPTSPRSQILVFLTPEPEDSCSSICAYTSDLLASRIASRVCLVETNPNMVSLERRLSFKQKNGLADLLLNADLKIEDAVAQVPDGDLWLLTGGFLQPHGDLLAGLTPLLGRMNQNHSRVGTFLIHPPFTQLLDRMNELRACFDFILIDAPPVSTSRDALLLAQLADAAVLILPASRAHQDTARHLKQKLEAINIALLGVVLTDEPHSGSQAISEQKPSVARSSDDFKTWTKQAAPGS